MHFSDSSELWSKQNYIDVVVDVELSPRRAQ